MTWGKLLPLICVPDCLWGTREHRNMILRTWVFFLFSAIGVRRVQGFMHDCDAGAW